jgi:hypothetical protein
MTLRTLAGSLSGLVALTLAIINVYGWWSRRIRMHERHEIFTTLNDSFIAEMASNHLPHIYDALQLIAHKFDVHLPDPPPIRYMPFDPNEKATDTAFRQKQRMASN